MATFVGGWGHAEPLIPLADLARRRGHHVTFVGQAAVVGRLATLGFDAEVVGPDTLTTAPKPLVPVDRANERRVMRDHFVAEFGRYRARRLGALFDRDRPGLIVCDEVDVGSVVAAEGRGIPSVTVSVLAAGLLMSPSNVGDAWSALRTEHALGPDPTGERLGGDLAIVPHPRGLRSPLAPPPPTMRFVRPPILDELTATTGRARPLVYVTVGTVFNLESGDLLDRLIGAMNIVSEAEDVDVVVTTGPDVDASALPRPGARVRVEAFRPQRELLSSCRAVVCHAGSGTLAASLACGVPVVLLPLGADQPDNADRCAELGVGVELDPLTATPDDIAAATREVVGAASYRSAARAVATGAAMQPAIDSLPALVELLGRRGPSDGLAR
ncbi:MAG: glycosyltransferase [Ilumatobacteraceae bacterium]|nr:glycosyltransferase [Ilumatobacteraceae bacterium]